MSARFAASEFAASGPHAPLALEPHLDLQHALEPSDEARNIRPAAQRSAPDPSTVEHGVPGPQEARESFRVTWRRAAILLTAILAAGGVFAALAYPDILPATWRPHPATDASAGAATARAVVPPVTAPAQPAPHTVPGQDSHDALAAATSATGMNDEHLLVRLSTPEPASAASPVVSAVHEDAMPPADHPAGRNEFTPEGDLALLTTPDEDAVQVVRRSDARDDDSLQRAWNALATGQARAALALYRQVLARQPDHIAAQLGEAAALSRLGLPDEATRRYRAVLEREPEHPVARANLLLLRAAAGEAVLEPEVRDLLSEQPSAALYALLGHLRGRDGQWSAAREAFLAAHHLEPDRADYLFNLGVSLEHLGEPDAALANYRRAAGATGANVPASVDAAIIARRIAALSDARAD